MPPVLGRRLWPPGLWRPAGLAVISALLPVQTVAAEQRVGVFLVLLAACDPSSDRPCRTTCWSLSSFLLPVTRVQIGPVLCGGRVRRLPREACDFSPHFAAVGCAGPPQVLMPPEIRWVCDL